jgi:hypothetical protein
MKRLLLAGALMAALLLPLAAVPATAAPTAVGGTEASAKVWSGDGVLRNGCPGHRYGYAVKAPTGNGDSWSLEVFLVNRRGRTVAMGYQVMGADPQRGKGRFQYCSQNMRPGRYKVKARLIWSHYSDEYHLWAKPKTIRLRRP